MPPFARAAAVKKGSTGCGTGRPPTCGPKSCAATPWVNPERSSCIAGALRCEREPGGLLSLMSMSFPVNSPRVTSVRGNPITHMSFPHLLEVLERYERAQALIELGPSETIDGQPTTVLVFTTDDASVVRSNDSIVRDVVWLNASSLVPLRIERYENRQHAPVVQLTYLNIKLNVGLTDKVFDLHSNPR